MTNISLLGNVITQNNSKGTGWGRTVDIVVNTSSGSKILHFINGFLIDTNHFQFSGSSGSSGSVVIPLSYSYTFDSDIEPGYITYHTLDTITWSNTVYHNAVGAVRSRFYTGYSGEYLTMSMNSKISPAVVTSSVTMDVWIKTSGINSTSGLIMTIQLYTNYSGSSTDPDNYFITIPSDINWTKYTLVGDSNRIGRQLSSLGLYATINKAASAYIYLGIDDIEVYGIS